MSKHIPKPSTNHEWGVPYMPYWTQDCLVNDWPPGWLPQEWGVDSFAASQQSTANREKRLEAGDTGTIVGLSEKSEARLRAIAPPTRMKP